MRSDRELCRKTYDLHVLALQETFIGFEGESTGCPSLCIVAQKRNHVGLVVEKVETGISGCQALVPTGEEEAERPGA